MLELSDLTVSYNHITVLNDISFSLAPGTFTALVGPNGTGKSSLLKAVAGLVAAAGKVHLHGKHLPDANDRISEIAYMPQDTGVQSSLTVMEVVLLGRLRSLGMLVPEEVRLDAARALERFNLLDLQGRTLSEISGGQRQMVFLAQSLFRSPSVLLLDEPTAALDLRHQLIVLERVTRHCSENGCISVCAMHDLSLAARFANRMIFLSEGAVVADGPPDKVISTNLLRRIYGIETEILSSKKGTLHITPLESSSSF